MYNLLAKKSHLHVYEGLAGVAAKLANDRIQDVLHPGMLDGVVGCKVTTLEISLRMISEEGPLTSVIVLVHCLQPADVVMRVRDYVDLKDVRNNYDRQRDGEPSYCEVRSHSVLTRLTSVSSLSPLQQVYTIYTYVGTKPIVVR